MKSKTCLTLVIFVLLAIIVFATNVMPAGAAGSGYQAVRLKQDFDPTVDGKLTDEEWGGAQKGSFGYAEALAGNGATFALCNPEGNVSPHRDSKMDYWFAWSDIGLYFACKVIDKTPIDAPVNSTGPDEVADIVQLSLDFVGNRPDGTNFTTTLFFSFSPKGVATPTKNPKEGAFIWEHMAYLTESIYFEEDFSTQIASEITADGYTMEVLLPWGIFTATRVPSTMRAKKDQVPPIEGAKINFGLVLLDQYVKGANQQHEKTKFALITNFTAKNGQKMDDQIIIDNLPELVFAGENVESTFNGNDKIGKKGCNAVLGW